MATKKKKEKGVPVMYIVEFHPSESIPNTLALWDLLRQASQIRKEEFVRGVYDVYEGDRYVGRYYNFEENKNLKYIYKYFQDEKQQIFLMMQEIRIRFLEDLWLPNMYIIKRQQKKIEK